MYIDAKVIPSFFFAISSTWRDWQLAPELRNPMTDEAFPLADRELTRPSTPHGKRNTSPGRLICCGEPFRL
jgi:hypothetical protein